MSILQFSLPHPAGAPSLLRRPLATALLLAFAPVLHAAESRELETVVVTASRQPQRASEVLSDMTVIEQAAIAQAGPNTTLTELLARQPGIELTSRGGPGTAGDVMIRGANGSHTLVLVDGMRAGSATTGSTAWGFLPLSQIERIEILRGPASSLYGADAIGGVVQVFTRRGEGAPLRLNAAIGGGSWNSSQVAAGLSGSQSGWRYSLQVADQRADGFSAVKNPRNIYYHPDKDGYQMLSGSGMLAYSLSANHEFGVNVLYSQGWNRYDSSPRAADYKQEQLVSSTGFYSRNRLHERWESTLRWGTGTDDSLNLKNGNRNSRIRTDQEQWQWQNDIRLPLGSALLAAERLEQRVSGDTAYVLKKRTVDSLLAGWNARLGAHRWQLNLRQDHNSQFGDRQTGSAAYGYQFSPAWRGSVAYGTAFKAPSFNDLYWPGSGNPALRPESSENREIGLHYDNGTHRAGLTLFRNDVRDLIEWAPAGNVWLPTNVAKARLQGWTLTYEGQLAGFNLSGSIDRLDARDVRTDKQLRYRASERGTLAVGQRQGAWEWRAELQASGKRYNDAANRQALGGYALFNLQGAYYLDRDWSVFARANNVFDRPYEHIADYATPGANVFVGLRYAPR